MQRVARVFGVPIETVRRGRRGQGQDARKVAMYLVRQLCDLTLPETAARFGVTSYGTVAWACHEIRKDVSQKGQLYRHVQTIERDFSQPKT